MVGRGDVDGVDVVAGEQFTEVDVGRAVLGAVPLIDAALGVVPELLPHVADGDVLHIGPAEESPLVPRAHVADADAPHHDPVARRRGDSIAERLRGDHIGRGHGGG